MHYVRIDTRHTHGFQLRDGHGHSKLFSDRRHGGRARALDAVREVLAAADKRARQNRRALVRNVRIVEGPQGILLKLARGAKRTTLSLNKHGVGPGIALALDWVGLTGEAREAAALALLVECEQ